MLIPYEVKEYNAKCGNFAGGVSLIEKSSARHMEV